jgi:alkane 1-monooxygenase
MLYIHVPALYAMIALYLFVILTRQLELYELVGMTLGTGMLAGSMGINVAHELGHRNTPHERLMAKLLLLPNLYMHFIIEHNHGHHKHVSTPQDPASARYGEVLYTFWFRSIVTGIQSAWRIETARLRKAGLAVWSYHNEMLRFALFQSLWLAVPALIVTSQLGLQSGLQVLGLLAWVGLTGIILLETVNYIEHYGLQRRETQPGIYETVKPWHSWNSDHIVGRIMLYELVRHSDHHYKANRKYQILRHVDDVPQMPYGYPAAMLLSLFPPLWFAMMNPLVRKYAAQHPDRIAPVWEKNVPNVAVG